MLYLLFFFFFNLKVNLDLSNTPKAFIQPVPKKLLQSKAIGFLGGLLYF